jgi:hypothetical protein
MLNERDWRHTEKLIHYLKCYLNYCDEVASKGSLMAVVYCAGTNNLQCEGSAKSLPNPNTESDSQTVTAATHSHNRFLYYPC